MLTYYREVDDWTVEPGSPQDWNNRWHWQSRLPHGHQLSTVFLCIDHNFYGNEPLVYESMVFPPVQFAELDMRRYYNRAQAKAGHQALYAEWFMRLLFKPVQPHFRWGDEPFTMQDYFSYRQYV